MGHGKTFGDMVESACQIPALGDALGPELWTFFCVHVATQRANPYSWNFPNLAVWQGWFLVFYYWISYEKSNDKCTSPGGLTFCKFVDFQLFIRKRESKREEWEEKRTDEGRRWEREGKRDRRERGKGRERGGFFQYVPYTFNNTHIHLYTFIYPQILLHTFIYLHIHQNVQYSENEGQDKTQNWS